jgi:hypothetical protein
MWLFETSALLWPRVQKTFSRVSEPPRRVASLRLALWIVPTPTPTHLYGNSLPAGRIKNKIFVGKMAGELWAS